jgi:DHA2 family multidrug resistance protein
MKGSESSRPRAGKWVIAGTVVLGSFVSVMDISIVNVAMPQMLGTFGVSLDTITWVAVSYSIAEIVLVTMAAWFSTLLGRKRFYILSFGLFTGASVLCGLARSLEMMVVARVLQGIGGGGLIPVGQAIMLETFPEEERGMAMAVYMMGVVVAPTVGPVIGGWLTDAYGWPWIFYINLPVGIIGMLLAGAVLVDPHYVRRTLARIDVIGIGLLTIGLTTLQLFLERGERENWFESNFIIVTAAVALVTLVALVWWELRVEEPVVNLRVLKNMPFMSGTCLGFIFGVTLFGSIFIQPLFLQHLRGYAVFDSALILMPRAAVMLVLAPIAGRLYNHVDSRLLIGAGIALMVVGYYDMAHFNLEVGAVQMLRSLLLSGAGMAFMFSVMTAASMRTVPLPLMMAASGLYVLSRRIGGNIGYAFVAAQVSHRSAFHRARLVDHITPYDAGTGYTFQEMTLRLADSGLPPGLTEDTAVKLLDLSVNRHATMMAYNDVFWSMGVMFVVCVPFLFTLGSRKKGAAQAAA